MWCPKCKVEYKERFAVCAECGAELAIEPSSHETFENQPEAPDDTAADKTTSRMAWHTPGQLRTKKIAAGVLFAVIGLAIVFLPSLIVSRMDTQNDEPASIAYHEEEPLAEECEEFDQPAPTIPRPTLIGEPARLRNPPPVRPSDEVLLTEQFWMEGHSFTPLWIIHDMRRTREFIRGDLTAPHMYILFGISMFAYNELDFRSVYYPRMSDAGNITGYWMPIDEYIYWGMRIYCGTQEEWEELLAEQSTRTKHEIYERNNWELPPGETLAGADDEFVFIRTIFHPSQQNDMLRDPAFRDTRSREFGSVTLLDDGRVQVVYHYMADSSSMWHGRILNDATVTLVWDEQIGFLVEHLVIERNAMTIISVVGEYQPLEEILDNWQHEHFYSDRVAYRFYLSDNSVRYSYHNQATGQTGGGYLFTAREGEILHSHRVQEGRLLVLTDQAAYAYDLATFELADSRSLPSSLTLERPGAGDLRWRYVLSSDLSMLAINDSGSIYLLPLVADAQPYMIHQMVRLDGDYDDYDMSQEWHHVRQFISSERILVAVNHWGGTGRYEIVDLQGNVLQVLQPYNDMSVAHMGGGFLAIRDDGFFMEAPLPWYEGSEDSANYYWMDFDDLDLRPMDWLNRAPFVHWDTQIRVSPDVTRAVFLVRQRREDGTVERTLFYLADFAQETVTQLELEIINAQGVELRDFAGNRLHFSYRQWGGGYGVFVLP